MQEGLTWAGKNPRGDPRGPTPMPAKQNHSNTGDSSMHPTEQEHAARQCTPKVHAEGLSWAGKNPRNNPRGPTPGAPQCPQNKTTATQQITACTPQNKNMPPTNAPPRCMQKGLSWAGKNPRGNLRGPTPGAPQCVQKKNHSHTGDNSMHPTEQEPSAPKCTPKVHAEGPELGRQKPQG
ncbi:TPA: hypothetical protein ACH3X3_004927 [Trebouxia sp. C0006]